MHSAYVALNVLVIVFSLINTVFTTTTTSTEWYKIAVTVKMKLHFQISPAYVDAAFAEVIL